jgi:hypothetical protein
MTHRIGVWAVCATFLLGPSVPRAAAQQRPLATEDPELVGAGRVRLEGGVDAVRDAHYPVSGLEGSEVHVPTIGVSVGLSSVAELQIGGSLYDRLNISRRNPAAPLAWLLTATGDSTHDVGDFVLATKIRFLTETATRPALGLRFATKLPSASNESGLGLDTIEFYASLLGAKTVRSVRVVANLGAGVLPDPVLGSRQNDLVTYGLSLARALTRQVEVVGEVNGRVAPRREAIPGTESRGLLRLGGRFTRKALRFDAGLLFGLTSVDPGIGLTVGVTYAFKAFTTH